MLLRTDPTMPPVEATCVICPGCHQNLEDISEGRGFMPRRHYRRPTTVMYEGTTRTVIGTSCFPGMGNRATKAAICDVTDDGLSAAIFRTQHFAAALEKHIEPAQ